MPSEQAWKKKEREVAAILATWFCGHSKAIQRMPLQGRRLEERHGDLVPCQNPAKYGLHDSQIRAANRFCEQYLVDVKYRKGWDLIEFLTGVKGKKGDTTSIVEWWVKLSQNASDCGKEPLLIWKDSGRPWLIMLRRSRVQSWWKMQGEIPEVMQVWFKSRILGCGRTVAVPTPERCEIFQLKVLLEAVNSEAIGGWSGK
jgi:hypothetical protein